MDTYVFFFSEIREVAAPRFFQVHNAIHLCRFLGFNQLNGETYFLDTDFFAAFCCHKSRVLSRRFWVGRRFGTLKYWKVPDIWKA